MLRSSPPNRPSDAAARFALGALLVSSAACSSTGADRFEEPTREPRDLPSIQQVRSELEGLDFDRFVDASFAHLLRRSPEWALWIGVYEEYVPDGPWLDDYSQEFLQASHELRQLFLERLESYDREALDEAQRLTYDVYGWYLDDRVRDFEYSEHHYPAHHFLGAVHLDLQILFLDLHPIETRQDVQDYVARLWLVGDQIDQIHAQLERARAAGIVPPRRSVQLTLPSIRAVSDGSPVTVSFYQGLSSKISGVSEISPEERGRWLDEAEAAVRDEIIGAYGRLEDLMADLLVEAPAAVGVSEHPDGDAYYAHILRHHTTTDLSAAEIHQLGLDELTRIHAEMAARFEALGYPADETRVQSYARVARDGGTVPASEAVATYEEIIVEAQRRVGPAFDLEPSAAVRVIGGQSGGFYISPSLDGSRPGAFYAHATTPRPRFAMPTLAYHEAVPGHHFQIGIARDLDLPLMQRVVGFTAYIEGWALYAERLAYELGWYEDDPHGDLGRLQAEAFRAARLVVDTGIHALGWSRQRAVTFLADAAGFAPNVLSAEGQIDRYTVRPGQATAYMVGMLKLLELREDARMRLGDDFDLVAWHRLVLTSGGVPLEILERRVEEWVLAGGT